MGVIKSEVWRCDCCGSTRHNDDDKSKLWIKFTVSDYFSLCDRDYLERVICPDCSKEISELWGKAIKGKKNG